MRYLTSLDEGYYQCYVSNMYGTAVSSATLLLRADIGRYHSSQPEERIATEGRPFTIDCRPVECFPKPSFSWALGEHTRIRTSKRVQIDDEGTFGQFSELLSTLHRESYNKKLSYCWETVRRESMPRIAEMDVEMTT